MVVCRGSRWIGDGRPFRKGWGSKSRINQVRYGWYVIMPLPFLLLPVVVLPLQVPKCPPQRRRERYRRRIAGRRRHRSYGSLRWPFRKGTRRRDQRVVVVAHNRDGREDVTKIDFGYRFVCLVAVTAMSPSFSCPPLTSESRKLIVLPQTGHRRNDVGSPPPCGHLRTRRSTKAIASTTPGTPHRLPPTTMRIPGSSK